jgi:tRNA(Ile)-lysidine synthase
MLDNIDSILQQECKLHINDRVLVGVSGGPDSLCLLHTLHRLGYLIIAAHVNHKLRPEAGDESLFVKQFAKQLGVDYISCRVDVHSYARELRISIEEAARTMRYRYLFEQAKEMDARAVLVGHNADDQVETILMHLLRGSGLSGLRGMEFITLPNPWSQDIPLIRPLLSTWREDILNYLSENELIPVLDKSNLDTAYFRNRLRHELIPILESYSPHIRQNLLRSGQIMQDDYSALQQLVNTAWDRNLVRQGTGYLAFKLNGLLELSPSIQRYFMRKAIGYHLPGLIDVDFDCIERGLGFLSETKPDGQVDLVAGLCLIKEGDLFWLAHGKDALPVSDFPVLGYGVQFTLNISSSLGLDNGWELYVEEVPDPVLALEQSNANLDPYQAWVDGGEITLPMIVRCRIPGERFRPLGMNDHSMKVSDVMINLKLPKRARSTWPLVCSGQDILWIPGYRQSQLARLTPESRLILHLTLRRLSTA